MRVLSVVALVVMAFSMVQAQDEPVTLTVWYLSVDPQPFIDVFQRWADQSGNQVELISIPASGFENQFLTRWTAGERPDILEYHGSQRDVLQLGPEENLLDLTDLGFAERAPNLYPALGTYNGRVYNAITSFPQVFGLYYNKQVLADAGLEVPQTFDDLFAICETLKEVAPGVVPIWENGGSGWPPQILPVMYQTDRNDSFDQAVLDRETTVDAPDSPYLASLQVYAELQQNGCFNEDITTAIFETGITEVAEGRAAMIALPPFVDMWNERFGGDTALTDSTIGFAYPSSTEPRAWWIPSPTGTYYGVKSGDPAREAAVLDFIRYATGEGYQQTIDESQTFPVFEGFENPANAQELTLSLKEAFDNNSRAPNLFPGGIQFDRIMNQLLSGQLTPEAAAQLYQLQLEQGAIAAGFPGWGE